MWRIQFIFVLFLVQVCLIVVRLFYLQVLKQDYFRTKATAQHYHEFTIPAVRGSIVTVDGSPLVMNRPAYLVYAEPQKIADLAQFIHDVSEDLNMDTASLSALFYDKSRVWIPLKHKVDAETVEKLKKRVSDGLGFEKEPDRYYPEASMAAHVVGFVASDENGQPKGYFGLEGFYDKELRGKDGILRQEKDVRGAPIVIGSVNRVDAVDGYTVGLHLDRVIQRLAEKYLKNGLEKYGARAGTVTVMEPFSGGIIAMASLPNYHPNDFSQFDRELYKNPVVSSTYEPGSTFKVLVMAAGIDSGAITAETLMQEQGPIVIGEYRIRTWNDQYSGTISMTDVIVRSSNVGMVFVGNRLGTERLLTAVKSFGFGETAGIDLEEESAPVLRPADQWQLIDYATLTFGQGIAVTPVQMIRAVAAIANGGFLVQPQLTRTVSDSFGQIIRETAPKRKRIISEKTAAVITEMMIQAVDRGEAKWAKPKGYRIAGKTGTAQIPVAGHYDSEKTIASFVGFAPADNPKFVMLVTLTEPTTSPWGSETAAPLFFSLARELLTYYGINPQ
jgi:cell division protein FtsI/penicillin-binding protein 2